MYSTHAQVCDLVPALSGLPLQPPQTLLCSLLVGMRKNRPNALRHASTRRLATLALSFRSMGFKPDFGFLHLYAQAVRFFWSNFEPWVGVSAQKHMHLQLLSAAGLLSPWPLEHAHTPEYTWTYAHTCTREKNACMHVPTHAHVRKHTSTVAHTHPRCARLCVRLLV